MAAISVPGLPGTSPSVRQVFADAMGRRLTEPGLRPGKTGLREPASSLGWMSNPLGNASQSENRQSRFHRQREMSIRQYRSTSSIAGRVPSRLIGIGHQRLGAALKAEVESGVMFREEWLPENYLRDSHRRRLRQLRQTTIVRPSQRTTRRGFNAINAATSPAVAAGWR